MAPERISFKGKYIDILQVKMVDGDYRLFGVNIAAFAISMKKKVMLSASPVSRDHRQAGKCSW